MDNEDMEEVDEEDDEGDNEDIDAEYYGMDNEG